MISVKNLSKHYNHFKAVDNLSFDIAPGNIVGFLGPNGAGKSTTMKMLTGFLPPTSGDITIQERRYATHAKAIQRNIGYLPEGAPAYGDMTVWQFLHFIADVRGLRGETRKQRLYDVIARVELADVLNRPIDNLSKGFKRRVGLAQAILHDPDILILDEPTDGLDPNQKHHVRQLIEDLSKEKIVVISTHILEEVTAVCNRVMIIANGQLRFDDTPNALRHQSRFCIAHGSKGLGVIRRTPVTLPINERIAIGKWLCHQHHCLVASLIAVRVVHAQYITHGTCRFLVL